MNRTVFCLLFVLLVITACAPTVAAPAATVTPTVARAVVSPTPAVAPTAVALPTPDSTTLLGNPGPWDASRINALALELKTEMRETSGLRTQLGPQADEFFRQLDQAETAAVQDLRRQMGLDSKPKGLPAPLRPHTDSASGANQIVGLVSTFATLLDAPNLVQRPDYDRGVRDQPLKVKENDMPFGDKIQTHIKAQTQVTGCRAEIQVEVTVRGENEGKVYEEQAHGKISLPICPDKEGKVPVDVSLQISASIAAVGYQFQTNVVDHGVGLVDEEANLISMEQDIQTDTELHAGQGATVAGGESYSVAQGDVHYTMNGINTEQTSVGNDQEEWRGTPHAVANLGELRLLSTTMAGVLELLGLQNAEKKWKDNYCVNLRVDQETQTVQPRSETPVTARLQHQFEGMELNLPIVATLTSGGASIAPEGVKVPAAATFRYLAPDFAGSEATVELISRSRRGIGHRTLTFDTDMPYYRADTELGVYSKVPVSGDICALDKPFTLKVDGHNPSGGEYTGEIVFTPSSATAGTWKHTARSCIKSSGKCGKESGSGTYQVEGIQDNKPAILLNATTASSTLDGYTESWPWPAWQIELEKKSGACAAK